jgi:Uma2 family endonuclease
MSAILENPAVRRQAEIISVELYHRMIERGVIDPRCELIRGALIKKMSKSHLHSSIAALLLRRLTVALPDHWVRKEDPLTFTDSEPEPDISVVPGRIEDYAAHPTTARLVIEVAISSEDIDREKGALYAEAGVEEFWLVLPEERAVEVHTGPRGGAWTNVHRYLAGETFTSAVFPQLTLRLDDLLGS